MIARSHGLKPIASVSATRWLRSGRSWTAGHAQGWETALHRLREEAKAAGATAVLDVKMRTIRLGIAASMDFTLVGTAMSVEGLPPSQDPIVATVPALEFVKLLEADVVPTGIAIGAKYGWLINWCGTAGQTWMGNTESTTLSQFWEVVRREDMPSCAGVSEAKPRATVSWLTSISARCSSMKAVRTSRTGPTNTLAVTSSSPPWSMHVPVCRFHAKSRWSSTCTPVPLTGPQRHHESYESNEEEVGI
jgi:hypothetical protein